MQAYRSTNQPSAALAPLKIIVVYVQYFMHF